MLTIVRCIVLNPWLSFMQCRNKAAGQCGTTSHTPWSPQWSSLHPWYVAACLDPIWYFRHVSREVDNPMTSRLFFKVEERDNLILHTHCRRCRHFTCHLDLFAHEHHHDVKPMICKSRSTMCFEFGCYLEYLVAQVIRLIKCWLRWKCLGVGVAKAIENCILMRALLGSETLIFISICLGDRSCWNSWEWFARNILQRSSSVPCSRFILWMVRIIYGVSRVT